MGEAHGDNELGSAAMQMCSGELIDLVNPPIALKHSVGGPDGDSGKPGWLQSEAIAAAAVGRRHEPFVPPARPAQPGHQGSEDSVLDDGAIDDRSCLACIPV
jgi:hypothetical protein